MTLADPEGWALLIAAVGSVVAAWKSSGAKTDTTTVKAQQSTIAQQIDTVQFNTNSRATKQDLLIEKLFGQVTELASQVAQQNQHIAMLVSERGSLTASVPTSTPTSEVRP